MKPISNSKKQLNFSLFSLTLFLAISSIVSQTASANPFANNIPASGPNACPVDHKMYYIGRSNPTYNPKETRGLVWSTGNQNKDRFTFSENIAGNKIFFMQFTGSDINTARYGVNSPYYGDIESVSSNAINFVHNSPAVRNTNNTIRLSSDWPVSKIGFKIQDLDSSTGTGTSLAYIEQARALNNGKFSLAYTPTASPFHVISNGSSTITGIAGRNCSLNECTIDAAWGYTPANTEVVLEHGNTQTSTDSVHAVGYSDFYYCLAPPRIVLQKALTGARVQTTDQFSLQVTGNTTVPANNFTTTGSGSAIDNNNTATAVPVAPNTTYTIVESILGGGDIRSYNTTYSCSNATSQSATTLPSANGSTTFNSSNNTRSFSLSNLNYGDEITCNITNTPVNNYTFTGFIFNDNGGIARSTNPDTKSDVSTTFTGNSKYFNGVFDSGEKGIGTTTNLSVSLTNCNGVNLGNTTSQNTSNNPLGQYKFTVPASVIAALNPQKVCIVQAEPDSWIYSVDTTPNNRSVDLQNGKFDYKTEGGVNLDFGEVEADYAALVLRKAQFVNNCPSTLDYSASTLNTAGNTNPRTGFSESGISGSDLVPGQCIAYRIQAYNRGQINLQSIQIKDELQVTPVKSVFHLPFPVGLPNNINNNSNRLPNSEIMSNQFNLEAAPLSGNAPKATLYFNTKYRTTIDP